MKIIRLAVIIMSIIAWFAMVMPVAAVDLPDSSPTIDQFSCWRNILETGDLMVFIYADIPYGTPPDEPVWEVFIWRLLDPTGATEYGSQVSYPFIDNGYGYNLTTMYFSAAEVTALGITWGASNIVRLSGNPSAFASPPEYNFVLDASDYSSLTDPDDVQSEMGTRVLNIAADLDVRWGLTTYSLLTQTETGTVLSTYGETFFRGAIYGLQGMCPQIFAYVVENLDMTSRTWTTTYANSLITQWAGTWIATAKASWTALFGTAFDMTTIALVLVAVLFVIGCSIMLGAEPWGALIDGSIPLIAFTRLGFFELGYLGFLVFVSFVYGATRLWGVFK